MSGFQLAWPVAVVFGIALVAWLLFAANRKPFRWSAPSPAPDETRGAVTRSTLMIPTPSGDRIEAWLYHPGDAAPPVVLMAPGLAGTKEGPLERFAWGFAKAGYAVLSFDFRSFGGSEGQDRHDIDLRAHVDDYAAMIAHVRAGRIANIDKARIALWGTSFSGASSICAAFGSPIEATILHVPYLGRPASRPRLTQMLGYIGLTFAEIAGDAIARLIGVKLDPVYITAYCRPGECAFAPSRDCVSRHDSKSDHPFWATLPTTYRGGWRNLMMVRGLQHLSAVDPESALAKVSCPVLIIAARNDDMIRIEDTRQIASRAPTARLVEIDAGHFDPYVDPRFEPNLAAQVAFLSEALDRERQVA